MAGIAIAAIGARRRIVGEAQAVAALRQRLALFPVAENLPSAGYSMVAFSRFWIASAKALGGLLSFAEHCFIVSSGDSRDCQSAGADGNAALIAASRARRRLPASAVLARGTHVEPTARRQSE